MAAPHLQEIEWAIHELENEESTKTNYILLSALYTCRKEIAKEKTISNQNFAGYSSAAPSILLGKYGSSDFLEAVSGKNAESAWSVMDELVDSLKIVNVRVYDSVMRKLRSI